MLVLTRSIEEKFVIGDNVIVTVVGVKGNRVQIGIDAPIEIPVNREEDHQRILKERVTARIRAALFPDQAGL